MVHPERCPSFAEKSSYRAWTCRLTYILHLRIPIDCLMLECLLPWLEKLPDHVRDPASFWVLKKQDWIPHPRLGTRLGTFENSLQLSENVITLTEAANKERILSAVSQTITTRFTQWLKALTFVCFPSETSAFVLSFSNNLAAASTISWIFSSKSDAMTSLFIVRTAYSTATAAVIVQNFEMGKIELFVWTSSF